MPPRANRHHLAGYVWHITQRCHRKQFLLKFARDRRAWMRWLYEASKGHGLCILDYTVTGTIMFISWCATRGRDELGEQARYRRVEGIGEEVHVLREVRSP